MLALSLCSPAAHRELTRLTRLSMAALQGNPCADMQAAIPSEPTSTAGASQQQQGGGDGGGGAGVSWLTEHVMKLKYQARVNVMNSQVAAMQGGTAGADDS